MSLLNDNFFSTAEWALYNFLLLLHNSLDTKIKKLPKHIHACMDRPAPYRKLSHKEYQFKSKPWITTGLQNSIKTKNHLFWLVKIKNNVVICEKIKLLY